ISGIDRNCRMQKKPRRLVIGHRTQPSDAPSPAAEINLGGVLRHDHPPPATAFPVCTVHGQKVDLFIALPRGQMIALEAKDSSPALNSVKRLNNDTAAKAKHFAAEAGKIIINVALLSGVFKLSSLTSAQESGLYLVGRMTSTASLSGSSHRPKRRLSRIATYA